mmetsp:Transcript_75500/g.177262  ORF Transcript_75500/g.177262 Transcript_75500/m.177262 type:complete len:441 (+) Transcript_75500:64-1386(+)
MDTYINIVNASLFVELEYADEDKTDDIALTSMSMEMTEAVEVDEPRPQPFSWAPLLCFVAGIALGATWISVSASVLAIVSIHTTDIWNDLQAWYNAPILFVVCAIQLSDKYFNRAVGPVLWYGACVTVALVGNAVLLFILPPSRINALPHTWTKHEDLWWVSLGIGAFSSIGYAAFMQGVGVFGSASVRAFQNGFMASGLVNLAVMEITAFQTPRCTERSYRDYCYTVAGVVLFGLLCSVVLLLNRPNTPRRADEKSKDTSAPSTALQRASHMAFGASPVEVATVWRDIWPLCLAMSASFFGGMAVFTTIVFVPVHNGSVYLVLVYVNMFADVLGFKLFQITRTGGLPSLNVRCIEPRMFALLIGLSRALVFPLWIALCVLRPDPSYALDVAVCVGSIVFVAVGGAVCPHAYSLAAKAAGSPSRRHCALNLMGFFVFLGV